jgi:hypothetical protein
VEAQRPYLGVLVVFTEQISIMPIFGGAQEFGIDRSTFTDVNIKITNNNYGEGRQRNPLEPLAPSSITKIASGMTADAPRAHGYGSILIAKLI